jgi:hypothetical protein
MSDLTKSYAPTQRLLTEVVRGWHTLIVEKEQQMSANLLIPFEQSLSIALFGLEVQNLTQ